MEDFDFKLIDNIDDWYYIFDQSAISYMDNFPLDYVEFKKYWDFLENLIDNGRFIIPEEVYNESKRAPELIRNWVEEHKEEIIFETENMYNELSKILKDHPKIAHKRLKRKDPYHADPHLIALAMDLQKKGEKVMIITNESPGSQKIPTVAKKYKIDCMTLYQLFEKHGILKRRDKYKK